MTTVTMMAAAWMAMVGAVAEHPVDSVWNVMDFGAVADGATDNSAAFQSALDAAHAADGGTVTAPTGRYRFEKEITVPTNVTLRGTFSYSPAHSGLRDKGHEKPVYGSVLEPVCGAGSEEGPAFISLQSNATLQGFTIYYPEQDPNTEVPTPYPYAVAMRQNNPALLDMQLLNPFNGIDASHNQRALIRNIHGQPMHIGLFVDAIYDIGRVENVHWNPWWSMNTPAYRWQVAHGIGFIFGKTDWHYVINTFCFGYNVGYKFIKTGRGSTNGNFLGIGADDCWTSLVVEQSEPMGILITNGEFVSFRGPDPTMIRVGPEHTGTIRFNNCAFWGPAHRNAVIDGYGTVGFTDCTFMQWGHPGDSKEKKEEWADDHAIQVLGGSVLLRGCEFIEDKPQVFLGEKVQRAIITGNLINGEERVTNESKGVIIVKDNAATPVKTNAALREQIKKSPGVRADFLKKSLKQ
jgi:hypothetical protein